MLFIYTRYEYVLGSKDITATLKNETKPQRFNLHIITPATKFLGFPVGGGLVKMSRLVNQQGQVIHARNYSPEIKEEVKNFKKTLTIPYFKLWKGYLFIASIAIVGSIIYGIKLNSDGKKYRNEKENLAKSAQQLQTGQLYGANFFTDAEGNNIQGLPAGWVKIVKIEGDTVFVQRSKKTSDRAMFEMKDLASIKPTSDADWNDHIEKMNYPLFKEAIQNKNLSGIDLSYIGVDHDKYPGVIMSFKGVE
ncbi:hypothetical protein ACK8HY_20585 [Sphingobacterium sp. NGMCC 1.201703]|uniref:hypothetical protein n=1 Tax=Sphingobacterium sp. NGMCC 1.201703 TaxID=3388657 RepID=UPI0039FCB7F6